MTPEIATEAILETKTEPKGHFGPKVGFWGCPGCNSRHFSGLSSRCQIQLQIQLQLHFSSTLQLQLQLQLQLHP